MSSPTLLKDSRLNGRIAIITGASSGLGRATALRYAASGARVACADMHQKPPNAPEDFMPIDVEINNEHGPNTAIFIPVNVTDEQSITGMIKSTVDWAGRLDIICNYAGIATETRGAPQRRIHETPIEDYDQGMAVNARGTWLCCKHAITQFLAQDALPPNARGDATRGWIINAASIYGLVGGPAVPVYVPGKHAVLGMTRQMAIDYARDRIHVNALCPGFVASPMIKRVMDAEGGEEMLGRIHPWGSIGTAADIANAALFLASDEAAWITGHSLAIDGGYTCQ